jgi:hypothetical protein
MFAVALGHLSGSAARDVRPFLDRYVASNDEWLRNGARDALEIVDL